MKFLPLKPKDHFHGVRSQQRPPTMASETLPTLAGRPRGGPVTHDQAKQLLSIYPVSD